MIKVTFEVKDEETDEILWQSCFRRSKNKKGYYRFIKAENPCTTPFRQKIEITLLD